MPVTTVRVVSIAATHLKARIEGSFYWTVPEAETYAAAIAEGSASAVALPEPLGTLVSVLGEYIGVWIETAADYANDENLSLARRSWQRPRVKLYGVYAHYCAGPKYKFPFHLNVCLDFHAVAQRGAWAWDYAYWQRLKKEVGH